MRKYDTILFDLDDTLIDNSKAILFAFKEVLKFLQIPYSEELYRAWLKFDEVYWKDFSDGNLIIPSRINRLDDLVQYVRVGIFIRFFEKISYRKARDAKELYYANLGVNIIPMEGALDLLSSLKPDYNILVATNAASEVAHSKIKRANFIPYVDSVVSACEKFILKPDTRFFDYLCMKNRIKDRSRLLMVGDSLDTDVMGGMQSGIDTCWYNYKGQCLPEEYKPTMVVTDLRQVKEKIKTFEF